MRMSITVKTLVMTGDSELKKIFLKPIDMVGSE